jgi:hypothetical protein
LKIPFPITLLWQAISQFPNLPITKSPNNSHGILFDFNFKKEPMSRKQIIAGIGILSLAGIVLYLRHRRQTHHINRLRAEEVSEHGYETAHDVLFPNKKRKTGKTKLKM